LSTKVKFAWVTQCREDSRSVEAELGERFLKFVTEWIVTESSVLCDMPSPAKNF
jgi:hypothetical protein